MAMHNITIDKEEYLSLLKCKLYVMMESTFEWNNEFYQESLEIERKIKQLEEELTNQLTK